MSIQSVAGNNIAGGTTGQVLGFVAPPPNPESLGLDMYRFLIEAMRHADQNGGNLFLQRYLEGPQQIWQETQDRIFSVKDLWSIIECPDKFLPLLKNIVGWTPELAPITDRLDSVSLRRLIANSVPLWNTRGPEDTIRNILGLLTGARCRTWNWFETRWLLGESCLTEEHDGYDTWLAFNPPNEVNNPLPSPSPAAILVASDDHNRINIRIVDNGNLDRTLVVQICKLMRPVSERFEIAYITFLDLFEVDTDNSQWTSFTAAPIAVAAGSAKLINTAATERAYVSVDGAFDWTNLIAYWRMKVTDVGDFGVSFYIKDATNRYDALIKTASNQVLLRKVVAGVPTTLVTVLLNTVPMSVLPGIFYGVRVQVSPEGATNRIKIYLDGILVIETTDATWSVGTLGFFHDVNASIEVTEVEMFQLPMDEDFIEIN